MHVGTRGIPASVHAATHPICTRTMYIRAPLEDTHEASLRHSTISRQDTHPKPLRTNTTTPPSQAATHQRLSHTPHQQRRATALLPRTYRGHESTPRQWRPQTQGGGLTLRATSPCIGHGLGCLLNSCARAAGRTRIRASQLSCGSILQPSATAHSIPNTSQPLTYTRSASVSLTQRQPWQAHQADAPMPSVFVAA